MKVILTQDLKGRGTEGDVIEVARGFAVNYLFPRRIATEATAGNLKQLGLRRGNIEKRKAERKADAEGLAGMLAGKTVVVEARAGEDGRLFGSVTASMVEDAIKAQYDLVVDRRKIDLHAHGFKTVGVHPASVSLFEGVKVDLNVDVVREGDGAAAINAAGAPEAEAVVETVVEGPAEDIEETPAEEAPQADQE